MASVKPMPRLEAGGAGSGSTRRIRWSVGLGACDCDQAPVGIVTWAEVSEAVSVVGAVGEVPPVGSMPTSLVIV